MDITIDDILEKVRQYHPSADVSVLQKAYAFSVSAHEGQLRKSGQPYVTHPIEVASILADMHLDTASIAAGMLHDTIEDTSKTKEEISQFFGAAIAHLVDGVTKLSKLRFSSKEDHQAENFRKMILAMAKDIRVILIKLADRLHNLKTLQFMKEEKQVTIAQETMDIYAPIANRLGMAWLKIELEDLSFRYLKPETFEQIVKKMGNLREIKEDYIQRVTYEVKKHFDPHLSHYQISGRLKHHYSIFSKMERQNIPFESVNDLMAFRIITDTVDQCYEALGLLHSLWRPVPGRFKDYIAMPKTNGYQSLHTTLICLDGQRVEFQMRTHQMHEVAEKGIAAHWSYKEDGQIDIKDQKSFQWLRQLVDWQKELTDDSIEFLDTVKHDLFSSDIFVFTPKGEVKALPYGASVLDFAYSIHTDVGHRCHLALVNNQIAPLNQKLDSGDEVEIKTDKTAHPKRDWLLWVTSSRAKARIRQYLKQEQRKKSIGLGLKIFEDACRKLKLKPNRILDSKRFLEKLNQDNFQNIDQFYSSLAYGKTSPEVFLRELFPDLKKLDQPEHTENLIARIFKKVASRNKEIVEVGGMDDILVTFAKCCLPIAGDRIIGFVTRGHGVAIHRIDCPKVLATDEQRRIPVNWKTDIQILRPAKICIHCVSKTGMLAIIAQKISERKINITKALVRTTKDQRAMIYLNIDVSNHSELRYLMKAVEKINGVIKVVREFGS